MVGLKSKMRIVAVVAAEPGCEAASEAGGVRLLGAGGVGVLALSDRALERRADPGELAGVDARLHQRLGEAARLAAVVAALDVGRAVDQLAQRGGRPQGDRRQFGRRSDAHRCERHAEADLLPCASLRPAPWCPSGRRAPIPAAAA